MEANINGLPVKAYVDTGATISLVSADMVNINHEELERFNHTVVGATGHEMPVLGSVDACINTPNGQLVEKLVVCNPGERFQIDLLLGLNILRHTAIDYPEKKLTFRVNNLPKITNETRCEVEIISKEIKSNWEDILNPQNNMGDPQASFPAPTEMEELLSSEDDTEENITEEVIQESDNLEGDENDSPSSVYEVHLKNTMMLKPNSIMIVSIRASKKMKENQCLHIMSNEVRSGVILPNLITKVTSKRITVNIINLNDEEVKILAGTKLSEAEAIVTEEELTEQKEENKPMTAALISEGTQGEKLRKLTEEDIHCGDESMKKNVLNLMMKYRSTCWLEDEPLGKYTGDPLEIKLKENVVINKPPYRIPRAQQDKLDEVIANMLKNGIISRSKSDFNSPLIIVPKPDKSMRVCIDYRALNKVIVPVSFPIPRIADLLNNVGKSTVISSLDLAQAYHQAEVKEEDREKTAFTVKNTRYHYNRVPFGIQSAPGYFCRIINDVLYDVIGPEVMAYFDDILVLGKNNEEHLQRLEEVLKRLEKSNIKIKLAKCQFFVHEVKFLGYQLTKEGMMMNNNRMKAITEMPHPKNKRQLQSFLGVVNYYRRFVKNFAQTAKPLYGLLKKDVRYVWGEDQRNAVEELKRKLTEAPIVKFPDFEKEFHLHTDASTEGIGAVLMQEHQGILHPIEYISKSLNEAQRAYSATKLETLALVWALEQFRTIILQFPVNVYSDHLPLHGVVNKPTKDKCLTRWALLIQEYDINLYYLPGKENIFADALSRLSQVREGCEEIEETFDRKLINKTYQCNALKEDIPEKVPWDTKELRRKQLNDNKCVELKKHLQFGDTSQSNHNLTSFRIINGILYVLRKIKRGTQEDQFLVPYVPETLMEEAFKVIHSDPTGGHRGFERTMKTFVKNFYNYQESLTIKELCEKCEPCIRAKAIAKQVPIATYPIPEKPFQTISSDILGPLPITEQGNQYVMVIRDYTTRYTVLSALPHKNADNIIRAWRSTISNYGSSEVLITDNAQEYTSEKLQKFCKLYNTRKVEIAPYHPASQGLAERINKEINKLLRIYTDSLATSDWDELLPVIQLTINNTYNSSIQETPFYALYGYDSFTEALQSPKHNYDESDFALRMQRITKIRQHCREKLLEAQKKYTDYTNKDRTPKEIKVGQRVFAKLDKFKNHAKLDYPITGPFVVLKEHGRAFQLEDVATKRKWIVHPDFIVTMKKDTREGITKLVEQENESRDSRTKDRQATTEYNKKPVPKESESKKHYNLRPRR